MVFSIVLLRFVQSMVPMYLVKKQAWAYWMSLLLQTYTASVTSPFFSKKPVILEAMLGNCCLYQCMSMATNCNQWTPCCRAASVLPPWNSRCKIELIFGVMLQFNVVWCIHSRREIVLTIQSDNGKQGYKVGGKKYRHPKVVLSQRPLRTVLQRLDSETRGILSSQRAVNPCHIFQSLTQK